MNDLLQATAQFLAKWLQVTLPELGAADWWSELVVKRLTPNQQGNIDRKRTNSLFDLDLAALLRVFDQNWREINDAKRLSRDVRNWIKELENVRNRWAHLPVGGIPDDDAYRDADTMARLVKELGAAEETLLKFEAFKAQRRSAMSAPTFNDSPPTAIHSEVLIERPSAPAPEKEAEHLPANFSDVVPQPTLVSAPEPARRVTRVWSSKTGSQYKNVVIEAHVVEVKKRSSTILLTYIDEKGTRQEVEDFGKLEQAVFDYLEVKANEGGRAVFILTKKPSDATSKLASNTMMLPEYRHHWQT